MTTQNRTKPIVIVTIVLLMGVVALRAQEPPPPPDALGGDMVFARFEGGPGDKLVKGAPYSAQAITETNQTLSDGNQIHRSATATLYRDSEGRTRREESMGALGPWSVGQSNSKQIVIIHDPVAGINYMLDPATRTAHQMPAFHGKTENVFYQKLGAAPGAPPAPRDGAEVVTQLGGGIGFEKRLAAEGETVQNESLGSQVMGGVQADGTRSTVTIPAGSVGNSLPIQIVTERWYSSQLQTAVMSTRNDPRVGTTTYQLTNINQAEPAPGLFQVPAEYTVQKGPMLPKFRYEPKPNVNP